MKYIFKLIIVCVAFAQTSFAQDKNLVSKKSELYFTETKMRGLLRNDIIYFVESDLRTVSAYENGTLKWQCDVILNCGDPSFGRAELRSIKLVESVIHVVYGNRYADLSIKDGKVLATGFD